MHFKFIIKKEKYVEKTKELNNFLKEAKTVLEKEIPSAIEDKSKDYDDTYKILYNILTEKEKILTNGKGYRKLLLNEIIYLDPEVEEIISNLYKHLQLIFHEYNQDKY